MKQLIAGPKALRHPKPYFACEIMPYPDSLATRLNRLQKKAIAEERSNLRGLKPAGFWDAYAGLKARSSTVLGNLSLFPKHVKSCFSKACDVLFPKHAEVAFPKACEVVFPKHVKSCFFHHKRCPLSVVS